MLSIFLSDLQFLNPATDSLVDLLEFSRRNDPARGCQEHANSEALPHSNRLEIGQDGRLLHNRDVLVIDDRHSVEVRALCPDERVEGGMERCSYPHEREDSRAEISAARALDVAQVAHRNPGELRDLLDGERGSPAPPRHLLGQ